MAAVPKITPNSCAVLSPFFCSVGPAAVEGNAVTDEDVVGVAEIVSVIILVGVTFEFVTNSEGGELSIVPDEDSGARVTPPVISTGDAVGGGIPLVTSGVKLPPSTLANLVL